jgi:hypothetical protein
MNVFHNTFALSPEVQGAELQLYDGQSNAWITSNFRHEGIAKTTCEGRLKRIYCGEVGGVC